MNVLVMLQLRASARNILFYKGMPGSLFQRWSPSIEDSSPPGRSLLLPTCPALCNQGCPRLKGCLPGQSQPCRKVLSLIRVPLVASLVSDDAELFSVYLIATCLSSFHIFPTFLLYCLFFEFWLFGIGVLYQMQVCKYVLAICGLSFHSLSNFAILMKSTCSISHVVDCAFGGVSGRSLPNPRSQAFSLLFLIFRSLIKLDFLFGSVIHPEMLLV